MIPESLDQLTGQIGSLSFATDIFGVKARLFELPSRASPLFEIEAFETLLWRNEQSLVHRLRVEGEDGVISVPRRRAAKDLFRWAIDKFLEGNVLTFAGLETVEPSAAVLASDIGQKLLANVTVDAVLLPSSGSLLRRSANGIEDFLLIQSFNSTSVELIEEPHASQPISLREGHALYMPEQAFRILPAQETRVCLLVCVVPLGPVDLLECLIEVATEQSKTFRVTPGCPSPRQDTYSAAIAALVTSSHSTTLRKLAAARLKLRLADQHRPAPGGLLRIADAYAGVGWTTVVRVRPGAVFAFTPTDEGTYLYVPGLGGVSEREADPGGLMFPAEAEALLAAIRETNDPFTARDLPDGFSATARLATIRRLLWEGALELVESHAPAHRRPK